MPKHKALEVKLHLRSKVESYSMVLEKRLKMKQKFARNIPMIVSAFTMANVIGFSALEVSCSTHRILPTKGA